MAPSERALPASVTCLTVDHMKMRPAYRTRFSAPDTLRRIPTGLAALTVAWSVGLIALASAGGCAQGEWEQFIESFKRDKREQPAAMPSPAAKTKALEGTIGPLVTIDGLRLTQVRGYGLVIDLVDTGGRDGPEVVKNYITKEVRRRQEVGMPGLPAGALFEDLNSCMVEVTGLIPAAAKKGDRFDVVIRALGSEAKSLVGGRLVLCDLKLYADSPSGVIEGKTLATASGPLLVSPFDRQGLPTDKVDLRQGFVLGGGQVKEPRTVRLTLNDPSYSVAQQIVTRLNGRWGGLKQVANAISPGRVDLTIPDEFAERKRIFLEQVVHTTLNGNPALLEKRSKELAAEIVHPDAEFESIGLAWESIGKVALDDIRELYQHPMPETNYFAGRTGMRMGDNGGTDVVVRHAKDPQSRFRLQAIDELGYATNMHAAGEALRELTGDSNEEVRIRAYLGLRRRPHPSITRRVLDQDNLILDVIDSGGANLIYVQRLNQPVVAIFGTQMRCQPPVIFPDGQRNDKRRLLTTITAQQGDDHLTVLYKNKRTGANSPPLKAPLNVGELVAFLGDATQFSESGEVRGLAVPYSEIVDILNTFTRQGSIPGRFVTEEMTREEEEGRREEERPESEY